MALQPTREEFFFFKFVQNKFRTYFDLKRKNLRIPTSNQIITKINQEITLDYTVLEKTDIKRRRFRPSFFEFLPTRKLATSFPRWGVFTAEGSVDPTTQLSKPSRRLSSPADDVRVRCALHDVAKHFYSSKPRTGVRLRSLIVSPAWFTVVILRPDRESSGIRTCC